MQLNQKKQPGFTLILLTIFMFILMLVVLLLYPLMIGASIKNNELAAILYLSQIKNAQTQFARSDLNSNGSHDYANSITELQNHNLIGSVSGSSTFYSVVLADGDDIFQYKTGTDKKGSFLATAIPKRKKRFKEASHQFRISDDGIACAQLSSKRGKKVKWFSDVTKCQNKIPKKEKRYAKRESARLEKILKPLFCKVLPKEYRDELKTILTERTNDKSMHDTIFNELDANSDGQLSVDELDLDSEELWDIALVLKDLIEEDSDIAWNQDVTTGNLILSFLQDHIFTTTYKNTELRAEIEPLVISDLKGATIIKRIKKMLSGCKG